MVTTATEPGFTALHRLRKAAALADAARLMGMTYTDVAHLDEAGKRRVEARAEVRRPGSDTTWLVVRSMMAGSVMARCPTCGRGNPDGEPGPRLSYGHPGACRR